MYYTYYSSSIYATNLRWGMCSLSDLEKVIEDFRLEDKYDIVCISNQGPERVFDKKIFAITSLMAKNTNTKELIDKTISNLSY